MGAVQRIVIVDIPSPGQLGSVFSDLILALTHTLHLLGVDVTYSRKLYPTKDPVIIFGMYRLFIKPQPRRNLPDNYFIFNLAPLFQEKLAWFDEYIGYLARQKASLDYAHFNADVLNKARLATGGTHIFNFGYINLFPYEGFKTSDKFVFYGSLNPERLKRLDEFKKAGVNLEVLQNSWGLERDMQIRMAKAVVNIGKYNPNLLEVYRIWHTLCLGSAVYSDAGVDAQLAEKHAPFVKIFNRLDEKSLQEEPISAAVYKKETDFTASVQALMVFIKEKLS